MEGRGSGRDNGGAQGLEPQNPQAARIVHQFIQGAGYIQCHWHFRAATRHFRSLRVSWELRSGEAAGDQLRECKATSHLHIGGPPQPREKEEAAGPSPGGPWLTALALVPLSGEPPSRALSMARVCVWLSPHCHTVGKNHPHFADEESSFRGVRCPANGHKATGDKT